MVNNHLIIVTNEFEKQTLPLTLDDIDNMWRCVVGLKGLAFFNGGRRAGASQPHKHAQLVPLPLDSSLTSSMPRDPVAPIHATLERAWISGGASAGDLISAPQFPFVHWFSYWNDESSVTSQQLHTYYNSLLDKVKHFQATSPAYTPAEGEAANDLHYSLLLTNRWIFVVPRSTDVYKTISVNSLGYAGTLVAKSPAELELLKADGPLNILKHVGYAASL